MNTNRLKKLADFSDDVKFEHDLKKIGLTLEVKQNYVKTNH